MAKRQGHIFVWINFKVTSICNIIIYILFGIKIHRRVKWSFFSVSIVSLRNNQTSQTQSAPNSVRRQTQSDVKLSPTGLSLQLSNSP